MGGPSDNDKKKDEGKEHVVVVKRKRYRRVEDDNDSLPKDYYLSLPINEEDFDFRDPDEETEEYLKTCFIEKNEDYMLRLDSNLCKRLAEKSTYFRCMLEHPMMEKKTGLMKIPGDEYADFLNISRIVMGCQFVEVYDISTLCSLYIRANYYDIPIVTDVCRNLIKKRLCDRNSHLVFDLAHEFQDYYLKAVLERFGYDTGFRNMQNNCNSYWGMEQVQPDVHSTSGNQQTSYEFYN